MEDDVGKNSLFLYTCTFNIEVATISILQLLYPVLLVLEIVSIIYVNMKDKDAGKLFCIIHVRVHTTFTRIRA